MNVTNVALCVSIFISPYVRKIARETTKHGQMNANTIATIAVIRMMVMPHITFDLIGSLYKNEFLPWTAYTLQYKGACKSKCIRPCPRILAPICATDKKGNTKQFNTECEMDNYNCEHPDDSKFYLYKLNASNLLHKQLPVEPIVCKIIFLYCRVCQIGGRTVCCKL